MAINLWRQKTGVNSYNPMPSGWGVVHEALPQFKEYTISFKAKSATSKTFIITKGGVPFTINLAPDFQTFKLDFTFTAVNFHFYYDGVAGASDIIIEDIVLVEKGTGKATINGMEGFGTVKPGFTGKIGTTAALGGNLHTLKSTSGGTSAVTLALPNWNGWVNRDSLISQYSTLDGAIFNSSTSYLNGIPQQIFSINVIAQVEKEIGVIPASTTAGKVQWIKDNVKSLTGNWHGYGGNVLSNPTGKADFTGKVSGSTVSNPHRASHSTVETTLKPPSFFTFEPPQANYDDVKALDNIKYNASRVQTGAIAQQLFSFNLIEYVKRKYGYTPDVAWLKTNISKITANWHGYGSGPGGSYAVVKVWKANTSVWINDITTLNSTTTKLMRTIQPSNSLATPDVCVDGNGFVHFLASAESSDGVTASSITTDFIDLDIELVAGSNKATLSMFQVVNNSWSSTVFSHTNSSVTKLQYSVSDVNVRLDSNGFVYFLAYTDSSKGIAAANINTDYMDVAIEMKQSTIVDSKWSGLKPIPMFQIVDDETCILESTDTSWKEFCLDIPVKGGQTYTYSADYTYISGTGGVSGASIPLRIDNLAADKSSVGGAGSAYNASYNLGTPVTFTTHPSAAYVKLYFQSNHVATIQLKRPMLNMGSTPAPYEKNRGERMVQPTAKKNLLIDPLGTNPAWTVDPYATRTRQPDGSWLLESTAKQNGVWITLDRLGIVKGKNYVFSADVRSDVPQRATIELGTSKYFDVGTSWSRISFANNPASIGVALKPGDNLVPGKVYFKNIQLEEGVETPYEPYAVQMNAKPGKLPKAIYKPADYGFPSFTSIDDYSFKVKGGYWYTEGIKIPVLPNTEYTYSFRQEVISGGACFTNVLCYPDASSGVASLISETGYTQTITSGKGEKTFTTPANCNYIVMRVGRSNVSRSYDVNYYDFRFGLSNSFENKPAIQTPKKNLLPPFTSKRWVNHSNFKVIDDNTLELNATAWNQQATCELDALPNTRYMVSVDGVGTIDINLDGVNKWTYGTPVAFTFVTESTTKKIAIDLKNSAEVGKYTFKNVQLELGGTKTPFEPYRLVSKPSNTGLAFSGVSNSEYVGMLPAIPETFDVTVKFKATSLSNSGYKMLWASQNNLIYLGITTASNTLFVSSQRADTSAQVTYPAGAAKVELNKVHEARLVVDGTSLKIYLDGVLYSTYVMGFTPRPVGSSLIGKYTGGQPFAGVIYNVKVEGVYDVDFTDPTTIIGTGVKSAGTTVGNLYGTPYPTQLNKLAKR
jgi:hypothetical protein